MVNSKLLKDYLETKEKITSIKDIRSYEASYDEDDVFYNVEVVFFNSGHFIEQDNFYIALLDLLDFIYSSKS